MKPASSCDPRAEDGATIPTLTIATTGYLFAAWGVPEHQSDQRPVVFRFL